MVIDYGTNFDLNNIIFKFMKRGTLKLGLFSMILVGFVSCQNKEKEMADKRISELESYVDSL